MPSSYKVPEDRQLPEAAEPPLLERHEPKLLGSGKESRGQAPPHMRLIVIAAAIVLLALLAFGIIRHYRQQRVVEAAAKQEEETLPVVNVAKVRQSPAATTQLLPGNMTPLTESYIYARSNGYVKKRYVDIGDRVKQGQLLAEIEAPDLDQQVEQARAGVTQAEHQVGQANQQLDSAKSQEALARVTWERYKNLLAHGAVAKQDADQMFTTFQSAQASVGAAQANVSAFEQNVQASKANLNRLIALQGFEFVRAPFAGVITARNFDVGALVGGSGGAQGASSTPMGGTQTSGNAGNAGASGSGSSATPSSSTSAGGGGELFRIAQIGTLRILANVPQESAPSIRVGESATVFAQGYPNQKFTGRVTRTSNSIDLASRTLLTEVDVENPHQMLLPGTYAQVQIEHVRLNPPLLVPGDSIIAGPNGLQIAMVTNIKQEQEQAGGRQHHYRPDARQIHVVNVQVGRDYGAEIEVVSGLESNQLVVVNPSDDVHEGAIVKPHEAPPSEGNQSRRGPADRQPAGATAPINGQGDKGGRGASEKPPGGRAK